MTSAINNDVMWPKLYAEQYEHEHEHEHEHRRAGFLLLQPLSQRSNMGHNSCSKKQQANSIRLRCKMVNIIMNLPIIFITNHVNTIDLTRWPNASGMTALLQQAKRMRGN